MSEFTRDPRADRVCLKCGGALGELRVVRLHDGGDGLLHECGTVYTREFMRDHFGIEWGARNATTPRPHEGDGAGRRR